MCGKNAGSELTGLLPMFYLTSDLSFYLVVHVYALLDCSLQSSLLLVPLLAHQQLLILVSTSATLAHFVLE